MTTNEIKKELANKFNTSLKSFRISQNYNKVDINVKTYEVDTNEVQKFVECDLHIQKDYIFAQYDVKESIKDEIIKAAIKHFSEDWGNVVRAYSMSVHVMPEKINAILNSNYAKSAIQRYVSGYSHLIHEAVLKNHEAA